MSPQLRRDTLRAIRRDESVVDFSAIKARDTSQGVSADVIAAMLPLIARFDLARDAEGIEVSGRTVRLLTDPARTEES